jgi:tetratricopeptide (TPR) repeat protein
MTYTDSDSVKEAQEILYGRYKTPPEILRLARRLMVESEFHWARLILTRAMDDATVRGKELAVQISSRCAACILKDPDLPESERLEVALEMLSREVDLRTTENQETLGTAGLIMKRTWQWRSEIRYLQRAIEYYLRGSKPIQGDFGYCALNAAYCLEELAYHQEDGAGTNGGAAATEQHRSKARRLREDVVELLPELEDSPNANDFWFKATAAEAFWGLGDYERAESYLKQAGHLCTDGTSSDLEWLLTQLKNIARLRGVAFDLAPQQMSRDAARVRGYLERAFPSVPLRDLGEKLGLALSGGGFRASLFHIGVLAALADGDLLRRV